MFNSLEIYLGLEDPSLPWGSFMYNVHVLCFIYTEASIQTQAHPWKIAAHLTWEPLPPSDRPFFLQALS